MTKIVKLGGREEGRRGGGFEGRETRLCEKFPGRPTLCMKHCLKSYMSCTQFTFSLCLINLCSATFGRLVVVTFVSNVIKPDTCIQACSKIVIWRE